jgi:hypothetical protein
VEWTHLGLDRDKGLSYEHNNEPLISIKHRKYYGEIGACWFTRTTLVHEIGNVPSNEIFTGPNKTKYSSYSPPQQGREY